ncbi:MAG: hypothetical protein R3F14_04670 [Polyangiaceae bacterium]
MWAPARSGKCCRETTGASVVQMKYTLKRVSGDNVTLDFKRPAIAAAAGDTTPRS